MTVENRHRSSWFSRARIREVEVGTVFDMKLDLGYVDRDDRLTFVSPDMVKIEDKEGNEKPKILYRENIVFSRAFSIRDFLIGRIDQFRWVLGDPVESQQYHSTEEDHVRVYGIEKLPIDFTFLA